MQDNEIKGIERKDLRTYLRNNLTAADYDNLPATLGITVNRLTKMLNYVSTTDWRFDSLVALFRKINPEIVPSEFIKEYGIIHELTDFQIQALDQLLDND